MVGSRSRYGLFVSAVGAIVVAVSLVTPWYGVAVQHAAHAGAAAGRVAGTVDAFHALPGMTVVLLVAGALAMLDVTAPLVRTRGPLPGGAGGSLVLLGAIAAGFTLFHMIDLPTLAGGTYAHTLREGAWLALMGSVTMMLGGMWPRYVTPGEARQMRPGTLSWG
ncbi:MAG TPA: hypothetical protein VMD79_12960 [Solirubrobacteraceae bacterium]|nr:hypothetical protein [Solirubrobacteraceae bacterium]